MEFKKIMSAAVLLGAMTAASGSAYAVQGYYNEWEAQFPSAGKAACYVCHDTSGLSGFTTFGNAFKALPHTGKNTATAVTNLGAQTNPASNNTFGVDWANGTLPTSGGGAAAVGGSGGGGCVTSSITTPLTMALAMLTLGFFVRRKKD